MDEEIERLVVTVRADTAAFARDVAAMRTELDGPFGDGVERAGRVLEASLLRALRTGRFGFEDLKRTALAVLADIAAGVVRSGLADLLGSIGLGREGGVGLGQLFGASGLPGRATGGPVAPGRAYLVGERGPELFVPTSSGQVAASSLAAPAGRDVRVTMTLLTPPGAEPAQALQLSARQIARAVRRALED